MRFWDWLRLRHFFCLLTAVAVVLRDRFARQDYRLICLRLFAADRRFGDRDRRHRPCRLRLFGGRLCFWRRRLWFVLLRLLAVPAVEFCNRLSGEHYGMVARGGLFVCFFRDTFAILLLGMGKLVLGESTASAAAAISSTPAAATFIVVTPFLSASIG